VLLAALSLRIDPFGAIFQRIAEGRREADAGRRPGRSAAERPGAGLLEISETILRKRELT
jgi:hypothetical protein